MGQETSRVGNDQQRHTATGGSEHIPTYNGAVAPSSETAVPLVDVEGFQVVRLLPYSPAHKAGLVPYFDIITAVDHVLLRTNEKPALQLFKNNVASHCDKPLCFTVFNMYTRAYRDVYCMPSHEWGGAGLLGCSIEWCRAESCPQRCLHIVDVLEGSPAAYCRELRANRDYIIGVQTSQESPVTVITLIKDQNDFYRRLESWHEEQRWSLERKRRFPSETVEVPHVLLLLVYNSENNTVKEVAIEMGTNPEAALGISVATGLLHVIPSMATSSSPTAGASLPVMNAFVSMKPGNSFLNDAPSSQVPTSVEWPTTTVVDATSYLQEEPPEQKCSPPQLPHLPPREEEEKKEEEVQARRTLAPQTVNGPVSSQGPHDNLNQQLSQDQQQLLLYSSPEDAPHAMLASISPSNVPVAGNGESQESEMSVLVTQAPFNPFKTEVYPVNGMLNGASVATQTSRAPDHHPGQHTPSVDQSHVHTPALSVSQPAPLLSDSVAPTNGLCQQGTSLTLYPSNPSPQQPSSEPLPTFTATRMPPPLHFPVFLRASAARKSTA